MELTRQLAGYYYSASLSYKNEKFTLCIRGTEPGMSIGQMFKKTFYQSVNVTVYNPHSNDNKPDQMTLSSFQLFTIVRRCVNDNKCVSLHHRKNCMTLSFSFDFFGEMRRIELSLDENIQNKEVIECQEKIKNLENEIKELKCRLSL